MFNSDMLEVAIGLVFVYLLFSFVATALREGLEGWLKQRGALLEQGLLALFSEPVGEAANSLAPQRGVASDTVAVKRAEAILEGLYRSGPIFGLFRDGYLPPSARLKGAAGRAIARKLPSYIPAPAFAEGLLEVVESYANPGAGGAPGSLDRLRLALEGVPNAQVRDLMRNAIRLSGGDQVRMRGHIEAWFDAAMDRVAGLYRRRTQGLVLLGALAVAVALNVNTITVVQALTQNSAMRAAVAKNAELAATTKDASGAQAPDQMATIRQLGLPIGWDPPVVERARETAAAGPALPTWTRLDFVHPFGWLILGVGWAMTAFAISLGAPFWFDVLDKIMIVRSTVKPQAKSPAAADGDKPAAAQPAPAPAAAAPQAAAGAVSETDRLEFGGLDPNERPREEDEA